MFALKTKSGLSMAISMVLLVLHPKFTKGHFLSQQRVAIDDGKSFSTFFTFAETPGIENAEAESMAQKAYEKGIKIMLTTVSSDEDVSKAAVSNELDAKLEGKYVTAKLPDDLPSHYALEGYSEWGVYSGHGSPALIYYYTSASKARTTAEFEDVCDIATNPFRVDMNIVYNSGKCKEETIDNANNHLHGACVHISVVYEGKPLPQTEVTLSGPANHPDKVTTDENGEVYVSVSRNNNRLFARAGKTLEEPGTTPDGESYDVVKKFTTSVLELHWACIASYPVKLADNCNFPSGFANQTQGGFANQFGMRGHHDHNHPSQTITKVATGSVILVIFAGFMGSLLGSATYAFFFSSKLQEYKAARQNEDNVPLKVETAVDV